MHHTQSDMRRLSVAVAGAVTLAIAIAALALAAMPAHAGITIYYNAPQAGYDSKVGDRHSLNQNVAQSGTDGGIGGGRTCAGARDGHTYAFYGSFLCGTPYRCHPYGGGLLHPVLHNGEPYTMQNRGISFWGADHHTGSCG